MASALQLEKALEKFAAGFEVDFKGTEVPAARLAKTIREAANSSETSDVLTIINAKIAGNLNLNALGHRGPSLSLQIIQCELTGGFQGRGSSWRRLLFAKSTMHFVELPKSNLDDLLIEECRVHSYLEAREIEITSTLSLNGTHFGDGSREIPVQFKEAHIGRSIRATNIYCTGTLAVAGATIGGEVSLAGSVLGDSNQQGGDALVLTGASIRGPLELCSSGDRAFQAHGPLKMPSCRMSAFAVLGAKLDGEGGPALIADGVEISGSLLLGSTEDVDLEVNGTLRFILARIGEQFQFSDGVIDSETPRCLVLDSARIDGDILIGHIDGCVTFKRAICLDSVQCDGRLIVWNVEADATDFEDGIAISIRGSRIRGSLKLYSTEIKGSLNIDQSAVGDLSLREFSARRVKPSPDLSALPERYAHEDDALVSALYTNLGADLFCDECHLDGGDMRLVGATISGVLRISRTTIQSTGRLAFVAQGARIDGGAIVAGSADAPVQFGGGVSFLSATIGSSISFVDTLIGSDEQEGELSLDSARVSGDVLLHRSIVHGRCGLSSSVVDGDIRFEGARLVRQNKTVFYANGVKCSGRISFSSSKPGSSEGQDCLIDGLAFLEGAKAGSMRWAGLELASASSLYATGMTIDGSLEALSLDACDDTTISLEGTTAASLSDTLGDETDGWGAGNAALAINGFRYDRLIAPSGKVRNLPIDIRHWRGKWLSRRSDLSSTQAARHLARILHEQGLHEGSRLVLIDAFSEEGKNASRPALVGLHALFGWLFGHGFSGGRALLTVLSFWLLGTTGALYLQGSQLLVQAENPDRYCSNIDPSLFAADVLLPVIDLGQEENCQLATSSTDLRDAKLNVEWFGRDYIMFSKVGIAAYALALYRLSGWILFSLALATWSGIFKRSGRSP